MKEKVAEFIEILTGFRKFIICLLIFVISIVFRVKGLFSGSETEDLLKSVALGFMGTNSAEGLYKVISEHLAARRAAGSVLTPTQDPTPEDDEVELVPTSGASQ